MREDHKHTDVTRSFLAFLAVIAAVCLASSGMAQEQTDLVRAVVDGVRSPEHAALADARLANIPGVLMSRTDRATSNLMLHVATDAPLSAADLNTALARLGIEVRCLRRAPLATGPYRHLDPGNCQELPITR